MYLKAIIIIIIGAVIGWITNYIAIKMLFKPHREINLGFFKVQGVIPKRKHEIGVRIAETIKNNIISMDDIIKSLDKEKIVIELENIVDKILEGKIKKEIITNFPMAAMFLSDSVIEKINDSIKKIILNNKDEIIEGIFSTFDKNVDFEKIIIKNVDAFSLDELEKITFSLAKNEFKHIEIVGAVLGGIIGIIQVGVSYIF